jgi:Cu-Zn family superoxide dismutase
MKTYSTIIIGLTVGLFYLLAIHEQRVIENNVKNATAIIVSKSNSQITGKVEFHERNGKVRMKAIISNASPGDHAIHIHVNGDCNSEDGTSAGGHWNPTNEPHGKWEAESFHRGDIGNISVNKNGKGSISRETDLWCIGCEDDQKNILGKAIIIHQGPDDFSSQPAGAAGARIGCGEIVEN